MTRFNIFNNPFATKVLPTIQEQKDGNFVKYSEVESLELQNRSLRNILRDLEWEYTEYDEKVCAICRSPFPEHKYNCELAEALKEE